MEEEWKSIPGFENYEVSNIGNVRNMKTGKLKSQYKNHRGYLHVTLHKNNIEHKFGVHRLILLAFIGEPPQGHQACHNNGIRDDNRLENLRWGSASDNQLDRERHGTSNKGLRNPMCKINAEQVKEIKSLSYTMPMLRCAKKFNVSVGVVRGIWLGKTYKDVV